MQTSRKYKPDLAAGISSRTTGDKVNYGLRFQILPGQFAVQRAKELVKFCVLHRIPAVHLFFNAEEWNRGHVTEKEARKLTAMFRKIIPLFRKAGLEVGLNPWSTILHGDRGRPLRAGQNFELMVSPSGKKAMAMASFACRRWRKYIAKLYGRMARLGFDVLWIEDDFRFHGHRPLDWGGDFSPAMLKLFSAKIGRKISREEVVKKILRPGRPHPWRKLWLNLWRECSEQTAGAMRDAVAFSNPNARMGLMSSHPDIHAAEGRDWNGLFKALAINGKACHRPHFGHYNGIAGREFYYSYSLLDMQKRLRPSWVESHPEIENFPFSRFNKSDAQTFVQMALAKIMGSEGLLLDLHPFTGNSVFEERGIGELLDRSYPALDWLGKHFNRDMISQGVGVPFMPAAPLELRLKPGASFSHLGTVSEIPGYVLGSCGIAFQREFSPAANVIWSRNAWGLTDAQIRQCLARGLWLDADAAEILVRRGYGEYLGIKIDGWLERGKSLYALERIASLKTGVRIGFNLSCNLMSRVLRFHSTGRAKSWTHLVDCMDRRLGTALSVYRNALGGTVAVGAFPMLEEMTRWNLNFQRQMLAQNLIKTLSGRNPPVMARPAPHCLVIDLRHAQGRQVVVINLAVDPIAPEIIIPRAREIRETTFIQPLQAPAKGPVTARLKAENLSVIPKIDLPFYGMMIISI